MGNGWFEHNELMKISNGSISIIFPNLIFTELMLIDMLVLKETRCMLLAFFGYCVLLLSSCEPGL